MAPMPDRLNMERGARIRTQRGNRSYTEVRESSTYRGQKSLRDVPDEQFERWEQGADVGEHLRPLARALGVHEHWIETGVESPATRIRMHRLKAGLTQAELGQRVLGPGTPRGLESTVQGWENPKWWTPGRRMEYQNRVALARELGVTQAELLLSPDVSKPSEGDRLGAVEATVLQLSEESAERRQDRSMTEAEVVANRVVAKLQEEPETEAVVTLTSLRAEVRALSTEMQALVQAVRELRRQQRGQDQSGTGDSQQEAPGAP